MKKGASGSFLFGYRLSVISYWLSVIGYQLSVIGYRLVNADGDSGIQKRLVNLLRCGLMVGKVTFEILFIGGDIKVAVTAEVKEDIP